MTSHQVYPIFLTLALALGGTACDKEKTDDPFDKVVQNPGPPTSVGQPAAHSGHQPQKSTRKQANPKTSPVYFVFPQDGSTVPQTFDVAFGVNGFTVTPAGEHVEDQTRGHHHIVIDEGPVQIGKTVPMDDTHIHFGKGQTVATLTLEPGPHKLTMQFADGAHTSFGGKASSSINVNVVASAKAASVSFLEPKNGAKVKSPFKVKFGIEGMKIRPAGEDTKEKTSGHHHLIIDDKAPELGQMVPADETHIHYGKGQTETEITLTPGKHKLTMQLADGGHLSYGSRLSQTIEIEVAN